MIGAWLLNATLLGSQANAQEPTGMAPLQLDTVLVAGFEAAQPFLAAEALRVRSLVERAIFDDHLVITMPEVPKFQDTTAEVYLQSCPAGQYLGCVFVLGEKASTDYAIAGRISATDGGYRVVLSFIDVRESRLRMDLDVILDGNNDVAFQDGVRQALDAMLAGEVKTLEADPEAEAQAAAEKAKRDGKAGKFAEESVYERPDEPAVEDDPVARNEAQTVRRSPVPATGRLSADDMDALDAEPGTKPWDRADLTRSQYRTYRASGLKLADFQDRLLGRKGQVLLRVSGGGAYGAWLQLHQTGFELATDANPQNAKAADVQAQSSVQSQQPGTSGLGMLELDVGINRWLEVGVFGGLRIAPYQAEFNLEYTGDTAPASTPFLVDRRTAMSTQVGARIGVVPFPAWLARPTLHVGGSAWLGNNLRSRVDVPGYLLASQIRPNNNLYVHVNPGFEVAPGRWILVFARADIDIPVTGRILQIFKENGGQLLPENRPSETTTNGPSLGASVGVAVRFPVGPERRF
jgi:hypothetical protein